MRSLHARFDRTDVKTASWLSLYSVVILRAGKGVVFWFGVLKFFPGLSPAKYSPGFPTHPCSKAST